MGDRRAGPVRRRRVPHRLPDDRAQSTRLDRSKAIGRHGRECHRPEGGRAMAQDQAAGATKRQSPVRRMVATLVDNKILDRYDGELEEHIATTYSALRRGMAVLAWFLPVVLWSFGTVFGIGLLDSMSAYYYEPEGRDALDTSAALWFYVVGLLPSFVIYLAYRAITHRSITKSTVLIMFAISVGYVITMLFLSATGTFEVLYNYTPMRTIFVGFLCITGSFLYLYKGFTKLENLLLNVAGISAVLVALFPTTDPRCATTLEASAQRGQTI